MKGKELKEKRKKLKLTQAQLADEIGVKPNTVARWERDELPIQKMTILAFERIEDNLKKK